METLPAHKGRKGRKGRMCSLQMDCDALAMLQELSPTRKSYGRYLSELVRRDYLWRTAWRQGRVGLPEPVEVGQ